jgi:hypothetical protein
MCVAVNSKMQLSPDTTALFAVLTFHSPSPKTFSPVESITSAISPRVDVLKLTLTDFARLLTLV